MSDDQQPEVVIVCMRIEDMPGPPVLSSPSVCDKCGARVWLAESSPTIPGAQRWCIHCLDERGGFEPGDALYLSEAQRAALRKQFFSD